MCTYCPRPPISINNQRTQQCRFHFDSCSCCAVPLQKSAGDGEWLCKSCLGQERQYYETRLEMMAEMKRRGFDQVQRTIQLNPFIPADIQKMIEEYIVASVSTYNERGMDLLFKVHVSLMLYLRKKDRTKAIRMMALLEKDRNKPLQKRDVDLIKFLLKHARF